jgi:hypothetical protein
MRAEASRSGEALPTDMINPPELFFGLALYLNAWHELDGERDRNKLEPIRRSSAFEYARDYAFDEIQCEELWLYIRDMDREFLKFFKGKIPKDTAPKPPAKERYRVNRNG